MYKPTMFLLLICGSQLTHAGEALIAGQGQVTSVPDYVEINITVDSKCYATPAEASKANDEAARKIVDFLNNKVKRKDQYNKVISNGGYTSPFQVYVHDKILCPNTFQKQNTITFRTQDLNNIESLFFDIQNTVYQQFKGSEPTVIDAPISYAVISNPVPSLSASLRAQLERKAIALAFADAQAKLRALFGTYPLHNVKVTQASEFSPDEPKPVFRSGNAPMMARAVSEKFAQRAPVQFEDQTFEKTIYFTFVFDDISL